MVCLIFFASVRTHKWILLEGQEVSAVMNRSLLLSYRDRDDGMKGLVGLQALVQLYDKIRTE